MSYPKSTIVFNPAPLIDSKYPNGAMVAFKSLKNIQN